MPLFPINFCMRAGAFAASPRLQPISNLSSSLLKGFNFKVPVGAFSCRQFSLLRKVPLTAPLLVAGTQAHYSSANAPRPYKAPRKRPVMFPKRDKCKKLRRYLKARFKRINWRQLHLRMPARNRRRRISRPKISRFKLPHDRSKERLLKKLKKEKKEKKEKKVISYEYYTY